MNYGDISDFSKIEVLKSHITQVRAISDYVDALNTSIEPYYSDVEEAEQKVLHMLSVLERATTVIQQTAKAFQFLTDPDAKNIPISDELAQCKPLPSSIPASQTKSEDNPILTGLKPQKPLQNASQDNNMRRNSAYYRQLSTRRPSICPSSRLSMVPQRQLRSKLAQPPKRTPIIAENRQNRQNSKHVRPVFYKNTNLQSDSAPKRIRHNADYPKPWRDPPKPYIRPQNKQRNTSTEKTRVFRELAGDAGRKSIAPKQLPVRPSTKQSIRMPESKVARLSRVSNVSHSWTGHGLTSANRARVVQPTAAMGGRSAFRQLNTRPVTEPVEEIDHAKKPSVSYNLNSRTNVPPIRNVTKTLESLRRIHDTVNSNKGNNGIICKKR